MLAPLPEGSAEVITLDKLTLAIENQLIETALAIGLDRLVGEAWRELSVRIATHITAIGASGILVALFFDKQVAETAV